MVVKKHSFVTLILNSLLKKIMPGNKKKHGDPYPKHSEVPYHQRVKGRILWGLLWGIFGLLISYFAVGVNYKILIISTVVAAIIGYFIGKQMAKKN